MNYSVKSATGTNTPRKGEGFRVGVNSPKKGPVHVCMVQKCMLSHMSALGIFSSGEYESYTLIYNILV